MLNTQQKTENHNTEQNQNGDSPTQSAPAAAKTGNGSAMFAGLQVHMSKQFPPSALLARHNFKAPL